MVRWLGLQAVEFLGDSATGAVGFFGGQECPGYGCAATGLGIGIGIGKALGDFFQKWSKLSPADAFVIEDHHEKLRETLFLWHCCRYSFFSL